MFVRLLTSSRPRFWVYLAGPYVVGLAAAGIPFTVAPDLRHALFFFYFLLPANLFLYAINDAADADTDAHNAKKEGYEARLERSGRIQAVIAAIFLQIPLLLVIRAIPREALMPLLAFILLAAAYSLPPLRLKARPFLDAASNVLYAMPGFFAFALAGGGHAPLQIIFAAFAWCAAMHAWSAVPDINADKKAGLSTIATTLGIKRTVQLCAGLFALSAILAFPWLGVISLLAGLVYVSLMIKALKGDDAARFALYKRFPRTNALIGFAITLYLFSLQLS